MVLSLALSFPASVSLLPLFTLSGLLSGCAAAATVAASQLTAPARQTSPSLNNKSEGARALFNGESADSRPPAAARLLQLPPRAVDGGRAEAAAFEDEKRMSASATTTTTIQRGGGDSGSGLAQIMEREDDGELVPLHFTDVMHAE